MVDEVSAEKWIEARFPELAPVRAQLIGAGWDNTVFQVNQDLIFRFPRRQIAVSMLATEARVLPAIAGRLPLAIPRPVYQGEPNEGFPWPFLGYSRVDGQTACGVQLRHDQRLALAKPIAGFLASLHAIGGEEAIRLGAGPDSLNRMDFEMRLPRCEANLDRIRAWGLLLDTGPLEQHLKTTLALAPKQDAPTVLAHGDLYVRHLMLDGAGRLVGVIDWGDLHHGDPAVDLSLVFSVLPREAHTTFERAYGPVSQATWQRARFRSIYHNALITVYGHETGDSDLEREGLHGLRMIMDG